MTLNPDRDTPERLLDEAQRERVEAAAFRRLVAHLQERTDVQNIELMNLSGFCRNCLSRWYAEAAAGEGIDLDKAQSREIVHGMPFEEWKARYQREATPEEAAAFERAHHDGAHHDGGDNGGNNGGGGNNGQGTPGGG